MEKILFFFLFFDFLFFKNKYINCDESIECFEYSCKECTSDKYGSCTKCREGFQLKEGTCPCLNNKCALCLAKYYYVGTCELCKNGYLNYNKKCKSNIDNCDIEKDNKCLFCYDGYVYNEVSNKCEEETETNKRNCYDPNCAICLSEEEGTCEECKKDYKLVKGECCLSSDNSCVSNTNYISLNCENNCSICYSEDECYLCKPGYYLKSGACQPCINGCFQCANSEKCQYCFSHYEMKNDGTCQLKSNTNEVDFNVNLYMKKKYKLIEANYKNEYDESKALPYQSTKECDSNCFKCNDSTGTCLQCKSLYILDEDTNTCISDCSDENCLDCYLNIISAEQCRTCKNGYYPSGKNCNLKCSDENCRYCNLLDGQEICLECFPDYKLEGISCKSRTNYMAIIYSVIVFLILAIFIIFFCWYKNKQIRERQEIIRNRLSRNNFDNMTIYNRNDGSETSTRKQLTKEEIVEEFEKQKLKVEKGYGACQFCKTKPGKYKCDCDCVVCKEHSILKKVEGDGEEYKVCFNCGKIVKKVIPIKKECNICLQKKINLVHFQCNCALLVCKECYVKCRMESDKCPGCRAKIYI